MDAREFVRLKERVEALQRKADRAEGALEQWRRYLHAEFSCPDVEKARKLLAELKRQERELEAKYRADLKTFERKWGDRL